MGKNICDQYSLLHFSAGVCAYFWNISLQKWIIFHILFELIENTQFGMGIINTYFQKWWPGGKPSSDTFINSMSDNVFAILGWLAAYIADTSMGNKQISPI